MKKVASLVYDVDFRTYDSFFKTKNKAIEAIMKDLGENKINKFFKVIINESGEIMGVLLLFDSNSSYDFHFKSLRLILVEILDYFVLCDIEESDLYIAEIAIDSSQRGIGFGSNVLKDVIEYAKNKHYKRLILDVDFRNINAKRLYEKLGFKQFNKKQIKILTFKRGMYNMELKL